MRRAANQDKNHQEVANYFKELGWAVFSTHQMGGGFPDLVVSDPAGDEIWLVEIKRGPKEKLTDDQLRFNRTWKGKPALRINGKKDVLELHIAKGYGYVGRSF